jgi:hypothetical protein
MKYVIAEDVQAAEECDQFGAVAGRDTARLPCGLIRDTVLVPPLPTLVVQVSIVKQRLHAFSDLRIAECLLNGSAIQPIHTLHEIRQVLELSSSFVGGLAVLGLAEQRVQRDPEEDEARVQIRRSDLPFRPTQPRSCSSASESDGREQQEHHLSVSRETWTQRAGLYRPHLAESTRNEGRIAEKEGPPGGRYRSAVDSHFSAPCRPRAPGASIPSRRTGPADAGSWRLDAIPKSLRRPARAPRAPGRGRPSTRSPAVERFQAGPITRIRCPGRDHEQTAKPSVD